MSQGTSTSTPILALESLREGARAAGQPRPGYEYFCAAGKKASFVEGDWTLRAEKLGVAVNEALDLVEATGVDDARAATDCTQERAGNGGLSALL